MLRLAKTSGLLLLSSQLHPTAARSILLQRVIQWVIDTAVTVVTVVTVATLSR